MKTKMNDLSITNDNRTIKRTKIIYWSLTGFIALGFFMSSLLYFSKSPELLKSFNEMGFPLLFVGFIGVAKFLGAIAIVNPWFPKLKEWAYAGFSFVLMGAVWIHIATNTPFVAPLVFLILVGASYFYYLKVTSSQK